MTTATIFGLALAPLYAAIANVESDRGATCMNVYQIRKIYVDDVNRIVWKLTNPNGRPYRPFNIESMFNRDVSEFAMRIYWNYWGQNYEKKTGKPVTYEVLARIHNGGPLGWKKPETAAYWERVWAVMVTQTKADVEAWSNGGAK